MVLEKKNRLDTFVIYLKVIIKKEMLMNMKNQKHVLGIKINRKKTNSK